MTPADPTLIKFIITADVKDLCARGHLEHCFFPYPSFLQESSFNSSMKKRIVWTVCCRILQREVVVNWRQLMNRNHHMKSTCAESLNTVGHSTVVSCLKSCKSRWKVSTEPDLVSRRSVSAHSSPWLKSFWLRNLAVLRLKKNIFSLKDHEGWHPEHWSTAWCKAIQCFKSNLKSSILKDSSKHHGLI